MGGQTGGQGNLYEQALKGLSSFLPGGEGYAPIEVQAREGFQQQTIPQIMEAMGAGGRGSSSLNQALAQGGAGLESSLAAQRAQGGMTAAGQALQTGLGGMGINTKAFMEKPMPFWQQAILGGIQALGNAAGGR